MYPGGKYVRFQTVTATPRSMKLIFGKNGFLKQVEILRFGKRSYAAAHQLRVEYDALKYLNIFDGAQKLTGDKSEDILEKLDEIANLFIRLSPSARQQLAPDMSGVFSRGATVGLAGLASAGATVAVGGMATALIANSCIAAGYSWWGLGDTWISLSATAAAGTVMGWVGFGVTAVAAALLAIKMFHDKCKNFEEYVEDMKLLKEIEKLLHTLKTMLQALKPGFDKYGAANGNLEKYLQEARKISDKYLSDNKKKIEEKLDAEKQNGKKINNNELDYWEKRGKANEMKIEVFRTASNVVLKDPEKFAAEIEEKYKATVRDLNKEVIPLLNGNKSLDEILDESKIIKDKYTDISKIFDKDKEAKNKAEKPEENIPDEGKKKE